MRRAIATVCLSGTLPEKLDAIAAARFDGVEIFENDLLVHTGAPRDVRHRANDLGLTIDLYQPFRDFEGVSETQFKRNLDRAERKFDVMEELGVPLILACSNMQPNASDDDALMAAQLRELAERAARRGLKVGYEGLAFGTTVNTYDRAWRIVEKADHPHLGLILDSFHTLALPFDWSGIAKLPGDRIFFVQLADAPRLGMNPLTLGRHFRNFPGQGDFDVVGFQRAVLDAGYTGPISLEIFNDDLRAAPPRQSAADAMRSLLFLEERIRRIEEEAPPGTRKRRRVELFDPPPQPAISGVAFVEFTVDDESEERLAGVLRQSGFRKWGTHRAKDVDLYTQGSVAIILNREPDSFAHSYLLLHGPSVCAIAVTTDDPQAALSRAEAYGALRFDGRLGPHEQSIPGVRALDGSLLYFVADSGPGEAAFFRDFEPAPAEGEGDAGLTRIDHIASALPEGQLDSYVLFYRAVLGLVPEDVVVVPDPQGLIRSKAVASPDRALRFPLNISESRNTATARSVTRYAGAGVTHIALESRDIFASAEAMRRAGASILPIPANYYEDIVARFGVDDELIERMQAYNILYDRIGDGEFLHFYTTPIEDRFSLEIVERRGGYDLYGAANAPVRIAALARLRGGPSPGTLRDIL